MDQRDTQQLGERDPAVVHAGTFDDLYRAEYANLVALSFALCGSTGVAEDLVQDAFADAFDRWERLDAPDAWLRRVVANKSVSLFRRRAVEIRHLLLGVAPEQSQDPVLHGEMLELWAAIRALPKRQAQTIALRYVDGASVEEIAEVLGVSVNTVKTHLKRARRTLSELRKDDA